MISVVCFKWNRSKEGMQLPSSIDQYGPEHVNVLYHSVQRNTTVPHRFICVTDDPKGLHPDIEVVPLWDYCQYLGGCYNRLYIFSSEVADLFGPRFITIDLDCVIVGNIDHILNRTEDFVINEYDIEGNRHATHQYYNGGIIMMNTGAREEIWHDFDPTKTPESIQSRKDRIELIGSDQAWIAHRLGDGEITFTKNDGVYDYRKLLNKRVLPEDSCIVMFPGRRDPLTEYRKVPWIQKYWIGSTDDMRSIRRRIRGKSPRSSSLQSRRRLRRKRAAR